MTSADQSTPRVHGYSIAILLRQLDNQLSNSIAVCYKLAYWRVVRGDKGSGGSKGGRGGGLPIGLAWLSCIYVQPMVKCGSTSMFIVSYRWQWQCVATYGQQCLYTTAEVHLLGKILNDIEG